MFQNLLDLPKDMYLSSIVNSLAAALIIISCDRQDKATLAVCLWPTFDQSLKQ